MTPLTAAQPDTATARAYWTLGRSDRERLFRTARRHSRHVRIMRVTVPAVVGIIVFAMMSWRALNPAELLSAKLPAAPNDVVVSGSKITMELPKLTGFTRDSRAYELTAARASQDINNPEVVEMQDVRAKIQMQDKSTANVTARDGVFDSKNEILKLGKNVVLDANTYTVWLNDAVVDVRTSNIVTEQPVEVKMLQGTLNAKRLEVKESGALLLFDGGVSMKLKSENRSLFPAKPGVAQPSATTQAAPARSR
ncbi:MAG: LPS export ABC transporter periplasmic protein LptC [Pseudolabrys sp.]